MYPRLVLLRKLLSEDGLIVIHIDENEYHNLILVLEEIFGKKNDLGTIIWDKRNPKGDSTKISYQHESIIIFSKNVESVKSEINRKKKNAKKIVDYTKKLYKKYNHETYPNDILDAVKKYNLSLQNFDNLKVKYDLELLNQKFREWLNQQDFSGGERAYNKIDEHGNVYRGVSMAWPNKKQAPDEYFIPLIHPETNKECPIPERGWRNPPETMQKLLNQNLILFGKDETKQPERQCLLEDNMDEKIGSILSFAGSDDSFQKKINIRFENPKPYEFATEILSYFTNKNSIILDSFAGSGTTAHTVLNLNAEDGENRQFILVEMEAYAESITAERVKRVIRQEPEKQKDKKIKLQKNIFENPPKNQKSNPRNPIGFSFYELGEVLLDEDNFLNEKAEIADIRAYIWYTETGETWSDCRLRNIPTQKPMKTHIF